MKINKIILLVLFAAIIQTGFSQSYRVKSISRVRHYNEKPDSLFEEFQYGVDGKVSIIKKAKKGEKDEVMNVLYGKNTINVSTERGMSIYAIKQDKAGNVIEYSGTMSGDKLTNIKYESGKIQSFSITSSGNKSDYVVTYDASGKILTVKGSKSTNPYEFVYENGVLKTISLGKTSTYSKQYSKLDLTWENGMLKKVDRYGQENLKSIHEFTYDQEGRVVAETLKDEKGAPLFVNSIQYESGDGNDEVFYKFYNWNLNIFMNATSYTIRPYWL